MSHTISYKHVAIQFPCDALKNSLPDANFFRDHFILLELHDDNNVTTINPYSRPEVGCRHWITEAIGDRYDIVRNAIRSSVFYKTEAGVLVWRLRPLLSVKDAALLFSLKNIDTRAPWEFITTEGPCFEQEAPELFMSTMAA